MQHLNVARPPAPDPLARHLAGLFSADGAELWLVGGAVRDALLGQHDTDLDFATSALPPQTLNVLEQFEGAVIYKLGEKFGTIGARIENRRVEITTYRSDETYEPGSRKPHVRFGTRLADDLSRRDFTINAMAQHPVSGELVDPYGGLADLQARCLRAVGDPARRFAEDPLRLLRAVRFATALDLEIESHTWQAMRDQADRLGTISRERIRDEYSRMLVGPDPVRALELLRDSRLMAKSVPELLELTRMADHGPRHPLSLWEHTMRVLCAVPPELELRWAALLHDIAKPATRTTEPSGRPRFFHHEERGAEVARSVLLGLRYPQAVVDAVSLLIETHMQFHSFSPDWSDGAVRRLVLRLGDHLDAAIALARADAAGHTEDGRSQNAPKFDLLDERIARLDRHTTALLKSPLDGKDLMERYGLPPGPWIREVKGRLLDEVLEGRLPPDDRAGAWRLADSIVRAGDPLVQ